MDAPILCQWDGEAFRPVGRSARDADARFVVGERYTLLEEKPRSGAQHRMFFASVNEAWSNLPECLAREFATPDHLRRYALIMTGYRDERTLVASSRAEALRIAAFLRPVDPFAVIVQEGAVVRVLTARSQSMKAMGAKDFKASMDAVLDYLAQMIGTDPAALRNTEAA